MLHFEDVLKVAPLLVELQPLTEMNIVCDLVKVTPDGVYTFVCIPSRKGQKRHQLSFKLVEGSEENVIFVCEEDFTIIDSSRSFYLKGFGKVLFGFAIAFHRGPDDEGEDEEDPADPEH